MYGLLAALVVLAVTGAVALVLRRRHAPRPSLASRLEPLPAGVKHLASTVSDLSDFELHLPMVRRALAPKRRLGVLLHSR